MESKAIVVVQARLKSERLPRKILEKIGKRTMLEQIIRRCKAAELVKEVVVAVPTGEDVEIFEACGVLCVTGPEKDLLTRLLGAAKGAKATHFIRVTADCPFVCPAVLNMAMWELLNKPQPVVTNWKTRTWPDGLDVDGYRVDWLEEYSGKLAIEDYREYFAQHILDTCGPETVLNIPNAENLSGYRLTVDYPEDLEFTRKVYQRMGDVVFDSRALIDMLVQYPGLRKINQKRADGMFGRKKL